MKTKNTAKEFGDKFPVKNVGKRLVFCLVIVFGLTISLIFSSLVLALDPPNPQNPTDEEKNLFNTKLNRLNVDIGKDLVSHQVNDVINSFPPGKFTTQVDCPNGSDVDRVEITVTTELIKWDPDAAKKLGDRTAMAYFWNYEVKTEDKVKKVTCRNFLMIDPVQAKNQEKDTFGQILDEALFYHEMLHGQLLIDAMKNDAKWKEKICKCKFDIGPSDKEHKVIPDLESQFRQKLGDDRDYEIVEKRLITTADKKTGKFEVEIGDMKELKGKKKITYEPYVPPGGNVEGVTFEFPSGETGKIKLKGKLIDKKKEGKVEAYIDPDNIGIVADVTINPVKEVSAITPLNFLLALLSLLGLGAIAMRKMYKR